MADKDKELPKTSTPPVAPTRQRVPKKLKTLSVQVPEELHAILDTASDDLMLDKAGVARLALLTFIQTYYTGSGSWNFPSAIDELLVYAASPVHMLRGFKRQR